MPDLNNPSDTDEAHRSTVFSPRSIRALVGSPFFLLGLGVTAVGASLIATLSGDTRRVLDALSGVAERELLAVWERRVRVVGIATLAGFYLVLGFGAWLVSWRQRSLLRRVERVAAHIGQLGSGEASTLSVDGDDAIGRLIAQINRMSHDLLVRERSRRAATASGEHLSRVQRAMGWVDSEDDARRVVVRALFAIAPETPAELLMAESFQSPLLRVLQSSTAPAPGCSVDSLSRCPAVQRGVVLRFDDSERIDACPKLHDRETPCRALCVPVPMMGRSVGVLHLTRAREVEFADTTCDALEVLVTAFGTRVGLLRALGAARLQAETDPLTGLLNRRSLEEKALHVLASCRSVVVVMGDLDHFKQLNDTHGHAAGDAALRAFSQVLRAALRPGDVLARYGGEEFTVLIPNATGEEAVKALDRVRTALKRHAASGATPEFTASFGASVFPQHGADLASLLKVADAALYQAKQQGRDRVVLAAS